MQSTPIYRSFNAIFATIVASVSLTTSAMGSSTESISEVTSVFSQQERIPVHLKIEPEFWWANMANPTLELMLHGDDIASLQARLNGHPTNISIVKTTTTDNPNYLFISLSLKNAAPQTISISLAKDGSTQHQFDYDIKQRRAGSAQRKGFDNSDVIYLITPDRFANGDESNDNHISMLETANRADKDGRHGGDIKGILNSLDYLEQLGITQLWINPLLENNQQKYSYHGYSTTDHYRIDPRFGSNADYRQLVAAANDRGIGIIKDIIVNHIGSNHWWMQDIPSSTWVNGLTTNHSSNLRTNLSTDLSQVQFTSHRRTTVQDPYAVASDRSHFVDGWFVDSMPDLNQTDQKLATYLIQNSIWWVEYANLSGIREDTYSYADKAFLAQWSKAIMTEYPNFNIVGEEWTANPITVSYWQAGKTNKDGYVSYLPSLMDFPLYETMLDAVNTPESWDKGFIQLYEMMANDVVYADPTNLVLFEGNHDTNRLFSLMNEDLGHYKMAMVYTLTSNRIPQIFYGTEVLMTSPLEGRHDGTVRADFPGGWPIDNKNAYTQEGLNPQQIDAQKFVSTLLNFRKSSAAIHHGKLIHYVPKDGTYVYFRIDALQTVMVVMNKNPNNVLLNSDRFKQPLADFSSATDVLTQKTQNITQTITVPANGVLVLTLN
ncbi:MULTISPECIES: glycoside hydrolase family 13 protein [unclassified Shewanella]|uniref:glycoside hydrolase family 13 protein n=1 Tax=unclassified Shewanella TaxID=196818 RepID=UPI001E5E487D|nr:MULTISPECIES: glycoside hydrolase family 13 protein [unclassified Shewanella]